MSEREHGSTPPAPKRPPGMVITRDPDELADGLHELTVELTARLLTTDEEDDLLIRCEAALREVGAYQRAKRDYWLGMQTLRSERDDDA